VPVDLDRLLDEHLRHHFTTRIDLRRRIILSLEPYTHMSISWRLFFFVMAWFVYNVMFSRSMHPKDRILGPCGSVQEREGFEIFRAIPKM
jgi:hypothetical protein